MQPFFSSLDVEVNLKNYLVLLLPETLPPLGTGQRVAWVELPHEVGGDLNVLLAKVL